MSKIGADQEMFEEIADWVKLTRDILGAKLFMQWQ